MGQEPHETPEDRFQRESEERLAKPYRGLVEGLAEVCERLTKATEETKAAISNERLALAIRQAEEVHRVLCGEKRLRQAKGTAARCAALHAERWTEAKGPTAEERAKARKAPTEGGMTEIALINVVSRLEGELTLSPDELNDLVNAKQELRRREGRKVEERVKAAEERLARVEKRVADLTPQLQDDHPKTDRGQAFTEREEARTALWRLTGRPDARPTRKATTGLDDEMVFDGVNPEQDRAEIVKRVVESYEHPVLRGVKGWEEAERQRFEEEK